MMGLNQDCDQEGKLEFSEAYTGPSAQLWILLPILGSGGVESELRTVNEPFRMLTWERPNFWAMLLK